MAKVEFFTKRTTQIKASKDMQLTFHPATEAKPEYFSYIDNKGVEKVYTGGSITRTSEGSYQGKLISTHNINLTYHPGVETIPSSNSYYSYVDNEGNNKVFTGVPSYDNETYTYFCEVEKIITTNNKVKLYTKD